MKQPFTILIIFLVLPIVFSFCKKENEQLDSLAQKTIDSLQKHLPDTMVFTQAEKDSINTGDTNTVMRIMLTTNHSDSLILRKKSHCIRPGANDPDLYKLTRRMYYSMIAEQGVGIAAPQVGINRNIIWVKRMDKTGKPFEVYINPRIIFYSTKIITFPSDGCLSVPNTSGGSRRSSSVYLEYYKLDGNRYEEIIEGYTSSNFTAIIFQHEIDHLNGILFIDRLAKNIDLNEMNQLIDGNNLKPAK